jgi:O-succinylbenzoic acid--CoA ligase
MPELVALLGPAGPAWVDALRRCWDRGDAVLPVDERLPAPALARLLDTMAPTVVVTGDGDTTKQRGRPVEEGDAVVLPTSGTTGEPKGVVLTHEAVRAAALSTSAALAVDPATDHWLCCLQVAHAGGLGVVTRAVITGTRLTVLPGFDAEVVTNAGATHTSLVKTTLRRIDPSIFRAILVGGDTPPPDPPPNVVITYGQTETGGGCVYDGRPLEGVEIRIDDGQVLLKGPMLARAYRDREADRPLTLVDGWLATGDGGRFTEDGRLEVDGRLADVIVTGGEKVWPVAVEAVLTRCPGVHEVAVVGRPDPEWGNRVVAVVVPDDTPPDLEALRDAVKQELGPWAAPKELVLVDALPRTALGKIRRGSVVPGEG